MVHRQQEGHHMPPTLHCDRQDDQAACSSEKAGLGKSRRQQDTDEEMMGTRTDGSLELGCGW
eukprot:TRINITY_DN6932_c0_g1_i1.p2 TRINITY_DN6932_c0_g1~~TRINITY_DN6932_c0_g1_i1.p2  ORF type:complete len:62 (-),score=3.79 TRINITY_DN6932_c0_g1_i1:63-248(-)